MNDQNTYKKRSIILSHDNDCYHHVEEMRRWREYLATNANKNHLDELCQAELDFNLESNPLKLWRPWFRLEDSVDTLQGATNEEYREILKKLIYNSGDSSQEIGKKKRIMLIKHNKEDNEEEEIECWIKLTNPEDEIRLEKISEEKKTGGKTVKKRNYMMTVGKLQDAFNQEDKIKKKIRNKIEKNGRSAIRRQRTRRIFIRILHNLTFNKEEHFGL